MKFDNQLRHAIKIIDAFGGDIPLRDWLKHYFRDHKQMGSRDRKQLSEMVYCFYRLGHALKNISPTERILTGIFLCNHTPVEFLDHFKPGWNEMIQNSLEDKMEVLSQSAIPFAIGDVFPWQDQLSQGIDPVSLCKSFLNQPDLFVRIRPGYQLAVLEKLKELDLPFEWIPPASLRLPNGFKVDQYFTPDKEVVIQDLSSQRTGKFFSAAQDNASNSFKAWDCCAASGGKSILLRDHCPKADLFVSDIRPAILANLQKRFLAAGIDKYEMLALDLANPVSKQGPGISVKLNLSVPVDLLLIDAPCSGSGTWARNPDELYFFKKENVDSFSELQRRIISNTVFSLKKKGRLVYITCSVFSKENERIVDYIQSTYRLQLERMEYITGYDDRADSMFAASFSS